MAAKPDYRGCGHELQQRVGHQQCAATAEREVVGTIHPLAIRKWSRRASVLMPASGYLRNAAASISRDTACSRGLSLKLVCFAPNHRPRLRQLLESTESASPAVSISAYSRRALTRIGGYFVPRKFFELNDVRLTIFRITTLRDKHYVTR